VCFNRLATPASLNRVYYQGVSQKHNECFNRLATPASLNAKQNRINWSRAGIVFQSSRDACLSKSKCSHKTRLHQTFCFNRLATPASLNQGFDLLTNGTKKKFQSSRDACLSK